MNGDITSEALCHCQLITTKDNVTLIICEKLWSTLWPCDGPTLGQLVN